MTPNVQVAPDAGNCYVEDLDFNPAIDSSNEYTFLIENPVVDGTVLIALAAYLAAEKKAMNVKVPEPFGRTLLVNHSVASVVTVNGFDYLNQPMTENITIAVGNTPVQGVKAFKRITRIDAVLAGNITVSTGQAFGVPFAGIALIREIVDGVVATSGTLTAAGVAVQTATTGDPRGVYNPNAATDGVKDIAITLVTQAQRTGGLYGLRHFSVA